MSRMKVEKLDLMLEELRDQCQRIEQLYERKLNDYIAVRFQKYDTSIDFYAKIIDNMNN